MESLVVFFPIYYWLENFEPWRCTWTRIR